MYLIESIENDYIINEFKIKLDNRNRIIKIYIDADHPNADSTSDEFCLSAKVENEQLSFSLLEEIETMIGTYNLNHANFMPWNYIKYGHYDHYEYIKRKEKWRKSLTKKTYNVINKIKNFGIEVIDI